MSDQQPIHKRRIRYAGTHPKKFNEKYKELNPDKYQEDVEKIKLKGQTPAGSHRPICVDEICDALELKPGMTGIDCTLGYGGHTSVILSKITPGGKLIGFDVDSIELPKTEKRIRNQGYNETVFTPRNMNFSEIKSIFDEYPQGVDFILADLGVSSMQLDTPERGFSFKNPAPLDLRLNPSNGESAADLIMRIKADALINILIENADEPHAEVVGRAICSQKTTCQTTDGLGEVITRALKRSGVKADDIKPSLQRCFQALRIAVNKEFYVLDRLLESIPDCLKPGGRVAILTFHSGEDRRVKKAFKEYTNTGVFTECVRRPLRSSSQERHDNPRSSCAKLRWAIKT